MSGIKAETVRYSAMLGARVTRLRKALGMTQAELARAIGVSQQAVFSYELGDRRISVLVLARLAKVFRVPIADLIGLAPAYREGRLSPKAMRHAERLQALRRTDQRFVVKIIDLLEDRSVQVEH